MVLELRPYGPSFLRCSCSGPLGRRTSREAVFLSAPISSREAAKDARFGRWVWNSPSRLCVFRRPSVFSNSGCPICRILRGAVSLSSTAVSREAAKNAKGSPAYQMPDFAASRLRVRLYCYPQQITRAKNDASSGAELEHRRCTCGLRTAENAKSEVSKTGNCHARAPAHRSAPPSTRMGQRSQSGDFLQMVFPRYTIWAW